MQAYGVRELSHVRYAKFIRVILDEISFRLPQIHENGAREIGQASYGTLDRRRFSKNPNYVREANLFHAVKVSLDTELILHSAQRIVSG